MNIPFGKYKGAEIEFVLDIDRKYCEWIAPKIKNRYPEVAKEIGEMLLNIEPEPKNPRYMYFGKYKGDPIDEFIFSDKSYAKWLIEKKSFKEEYPETFELLNKYYDVIYNIQNIEIRHFYVLKFVDRPYVKVGITKNDIQKRLYSYSHSMNKYDKDIIDYGNSYVFRTTDLDIEKKVLEYFHKKRENKLSESVFVTVSEVENYIDILKKSNPDLFYLKKCIKDFIPFDYSSDFKKSFYIKINQFQDFIKIYEYYLKKVGLYDQYNPEFQDIRENLN